MSLDNTYRMFSLIVIISYFLGPKRPNKERMVIGEGGRKGAIDNQLEEEDYESIITLLPSLSIKVIAQSQKP